MKRWTPSNIICVLVLLALLAGGVSMLWGAVANPPAAPEEEPAILGRVENFESWMDNSKNYMLGRQEFLELCGAYRRATFQTQTDDIVLLNNGCLTNLVPPADRETALAKAESVISLGKATEAAGIPFLYVQVPQKVCKYEDQMPPGQVSYINDNLDAHLSLLQQAGISVFDLREALHKDGLSHDSMYFRTDHHWKMSSGLWAAGALAEELNARYDFGLSTEHLREEDYDKVTMKNWYLGSQGRQVTAGYIPPDDFTYYVPTFPTEFRVEHPDKHLVLTGDFYETMYDDEMLHKYDLYGQSTYEAILGGNRPFTKITNLQNPDGLKILLVHDSYSTSVMPFLAQSCGEIHMIDVRPWAGNYDGDINACRDEIQPDIVIVMLCSPEFVDHSLYN